MGDLLGSLGVKIIAYAIIALIIGGSAWKLYNTIKENGQYEIMLQTQIDALENKNKQIELLEKQIEIQDKFVQQRDEQLQEMENKLNDMLNDLGPGASDQAPDSLKEYFKRLGQL